MCAVAENRHRFSGSIRRRRFTMAKYRGRKHSVGRTFHLLAVFMLTAPFIECANFNPSDEVQLLQTERTKNAPVKYNRKTFKAEHNAIIPASLPTDDKKTIWKPYGTKTQQSYPAALVENVTTMTVKDDKISEAPERKKRGVAKEEYLSQLALRSSKAPATVQPANVTLQDNGPTFVIEGSSNVTVHAGASAFLLCKIRHLQNNSVSWMRMRDNHIVTVDRFTFIADGRFVSYLYTRKEPWLTQIRNLQHLTVSWMRVRDGHIITVEEYTFMPDYRFLGHLNESKDDESVTQSSLQVRYAQERDTGWYECQVGTIPKRILRAYLEVVVPKTAIIGYPEIHVKKGTTVNLQCIVTSSIERPRYIFWYHDDFRQVEATAAGDQDRDGRNSTCRVQCTVGIMTLPSVKPEDGGNWTCAPSNLKPANITLHVVSAANELPSAVLFSNSSSADFAPLCAMLAAGLFITNHSLNHQVANLVQLGLLSLASIAVRCYFTGVAKRDR